MPRPCWSPDTRDLLLSDTTLFHRAMLGAEDAQLICDLRPCRRLSGITSSCPKPKSVFDLMAKFFDSSWRAD